MIKVAMSKEKPKMKIFKAGIRFILTISLVIPYNFVFAQGTGSLPCDDGDPFNNTCPIDNWVWLLVVAALVAGAYQLFQKTKSAGIRSARDNGK
jgi:hypothetical protein